MKNYLYFVERKSAELKFNTLFINKINNNGKRTESKTYESVTSSGSERACKQPDH